MLALAIMVLSSRKEAITMPLIENTASSGYVDKESTNIRLEREVKERVLQEASEKATTMTDVINTILKEHYKSED